MGSRRQGKGADEAGGGRRAARHRGAGHGRSRCHRGTSTAPGRYWAGNGLRSGSVPDGVRPGDRVVIEMTACADAARWGAGGRGSDGGGGARESSE